MNPTAIGQRLPRIPRIALALLAAWGTGSVARRANADADLVAQRLRAALHHLPHPSATVSACAIDLRSGKALLDVDADRPLIPASSHKVFAMAAALCELGPDFRFDTVLAVRGDQMIVIGDGDPGLGDPRLCRARDQPITAVFQRWAAALRAAGAVGFTSLLIDETIFDHQAIHASWEPQDLGKWYAAPVGALNLNNNCLDITVSPGPRSGEPARVEIEPPTTLPRIDNRCVTGGSGSPLLHHPPGTVDYKITGRCVKRWPFGSVAFPDPGLLFADSLRSVLRDNGVSVGSELRRERIRLPGGAIPEGVRIIDRHQTPIDDVLSRAGKNSQNLFAECLLKRAGRAWSVRTGATDPVGSWANGREAVFEMMRSAGIDVAGFAVADGSGLSRDNACTARQQASLLAWAIGQPWGPMLHDNLSVAGVDGSLRKRLRKSPGQVFAKTGTMTGVRSLAGYVDGERGPRFAFAITFNGYRGPSAPYKRIQDEFCRELLELAGEMVGDLTSGAGAD